MNERTPPSTGAWLRRTAEVVAYALLAAGGIAMLAHGAARWRDIAFVKETRWSTSPLPYQMDLASHLVEIAAPSPSSWLLVFGASTGAPAVCREITAEPMAALAGTGTVIAVTLAADGQRSRTTPCSESAATAERAPAVHTYGFARGDTLGTLEANEFVLLGPDRRVVYGSRDIRQISQVPAVIRLFDVDTRAVAHRAAATTEK